MKNAPFLRRQAEFCLRPIPAPPPINLLPSHHSFPVFEVLEHFRKCDGLDAGSAATANNKVRGRT